MLYAEFVSLYESLAKTTKKLEKTKLIADFLPRLAGHERYTYLLIGRVVPGYDARELGVSTQLAIKAIARAGGVSEAIVLSAFKEQGDLGDVSVGLLQKHKQVSLFGSALSVDHVMRSLEKLSSIEGEGAVDRKLALISELLIGAKPLEARYLVRTLLSDLRVGVAEALVLDAFVLAFFPDHLEFKERVKRAYDFIPDFAHIYRLCIKGAKGFNRVELVPGTPLNVMLAVKVDSLEEGFEACGKPCAFEHKYDGFRVIISSNDGEIKLFTRRLEEVTRAFPDILAAVRSQVKSKTFILDAEAVGYDPQTKRYLPFESISQRIRRKYDIDSLAKSLPVEVNVFDVLYLEGESTVDLPYHKRRALLVKLIKDKPFVLRTSTQIVTEDAAEATRFYRDALAIGEEGVMIKALNAPYTSGRYVGTMAKLKPVIADLDLVIVGADYGTGKRAGGLTSFILACRSNGTFLEVGRVSSGLKEKASEGMSYAELDAILQPLIISESDNVVRVKPQVVVSVTYQNIQASPTYSSGYALRFPRIAHYRPDRGLKDIASLEDIQREAGKALRKVSPK